MNGIGDLKKRPIMIPGKAMSTSSCRSIPFKSRPASRQPVTQIGHGLAVADEFPDRHHLPKLPLIAKADRLHFKRRNLHGKEIIRITPTAISRVMARPANAVFGQPEPKFFPRFAQRRGLWRLCAFPASAGQIPLVRKRDRGFVIAAIGNRQIAM